MTMKPIQYSNGRTGEQFEMELTPQGGMKVRMVDEDGNDRRVEITPDDQGNIELKGRGPQGEKSGKIDPSGKGSSNVGI